MLQPSASSKLHRHIHRTYIPGGIYPHTKVFGVGVYFVTTDARYHTPFFADAHLARIVEQSIWHERTSRCIVHAYVVMPDHLHMLLQPTEGNISEIIRSVKTNSSREINRYINTRPTPTTLAYSILALGDSTRPSIEAACHTLAEFFPMGYDCPMTAQLTMKIRTLAREGRLTQTTLVRLLRNAHDPWEAALGILQPHRVHPLRYQRRTRRTWER